MKVTIKKRSYAKSLLPWCPYVGGFWRNYFSGMTSLCWLGYVVDINRHRTEWV